MKWINLIGLALDVTGAILMYINTPHPTKEPKGTTGFDLMTQNAHWLFSGKENERKQLGCIRTGFFLLMIGFLLQFIVASTQIIGEN